MTYNENILSIVAGATEQQRLVIVHRSLEPRDAFRVGPLRLYRADEPQEATRDAGLGESMQQTSRPFCEQIQAVRDRPIVLRQESFSPAVGWFSQSEMELTVDQWNVMRTTLLPASVTSSSRAQVAPPRKAYRSSTGSLNARSRVLSIDGDVIALPLHADQAVPA